MTARENILKNIYSNKPEVVDLPGIPSFIDSSSVEKFMASLTIIGGTAYKAFDLKGIGEIIANIFADLKIIASNVIAGSVSISFDTHKDVLNSVDLAVLKGEFGVAENGAVFISEKNMMNRALPFITQHLVLVIEKESILSDMHQAYDVISSQNNYGVFIAGPSKTADIEQSLVIGAHGAKSLTVVIYG